MKNLFWKSWWLQIDNEFKDIFEEHDVLLARFPTHFARIIAHCKNVAPHLLEELIDFDSE